MTLNALNIVEIIKQVVNPASSHVGLHEPCFQGNEWGYMKECLDTGWVSSVGSYVDLFEEKLAEACGVTYAVPTVNGTAALHIALILAGVGGGDEVLMPSLTFVATANAVTYCGAVPHFVEAERETLGIDAGKLGAYLAEITERKDGGLYNKATGKRIAALVPVHIFGLPANMDALQEVADSYGLPIVADAAECLGSQYKGKPAASYGLLSCTSFNGNKIITTGGGGAILTDDADLAVRAKHLTTTAKVPHKWDYVHDKVGYNYRMPNINAALGCAQLESLDGFLASKRRLADAYKAAFEGSGDFEFIAEPDGAGSNYWLNAIYIKTDLDRDVLLTSLHEVGLMCRPIWKLMHHLEMYKTCPRMKLPVSEELEARIINLPSSASLGAIGA